VPLGRTVARAVTQATMARPLVRGRCRKSPLPMLTPSKSATRPYRKIAPIAWVSIATTAWGEDTGSEQTLAHLTSNIKPMARHLLAALWHATRVCAHAPETQAGRDSHFRTEHDCRACSVSGRMPAATAASFVNSFGRTRYTSAIVAAKPARLEWIPDMPVHILRDNAAQHDHVLARTKVTTDRRTSSMP